MDNEKKRDWKEVWYEFSQNTTLHGVQRVGEPKQHTIRRLIWILIVLGGLSLFAYQLVNSVLYYRSWPVTVNVKINYNRTLQFPAITLCNQNDFRSSAIAESGKYHLVRDFYSKLHTGGVNLSADAGEISLDVIYNISAHRKEDMIVSCSWDESDCDLDDFETTITDYGYCYTFNSGRNGQPIREVSNTGADRGLRLRLNIEQYEYMRGPNPGAGIKILIHDADEIPLVRDLGQAIPPGSYAFVGIQILQVNNLPPPHGQCDDSTQLKFFPRYSMSACLVDCKEQVTVAMCGCRDVYMPADRNGYPPVCSLEKYHSCFYPAIEEFNKRKEQCNCTIPCRRTMFDPTISYAITTNYETDSLLRSDRVDTLVERYRHARETIQRVEESVVAQDIKMVSNLNLTINRVTQMLRGIHVVVNSLNDKIQTEMSTFYQRAWFHWRWGLDRLLYVGRHDFTRGWEVMAERSFSLVTINYQEDVAYLKDTVRRLIDPASTLDPMTRQALAVDITGKFFTKRVIYERAKANISQVYQAFSTAEPLLTFLASPQRRYDLSYITLGIINDDPNEVEKNFNKIVLRLDQYLEAMDTMDAMLQAALNNSFVDLDALDKAGEDFEKAARSFNYYRFMMEERVAQKPVELTTVLLDNFFKMNESLADRLDEVHVFLEELTLSLDDADSSWQHILLLNRMAINYLANTDSTKTQLAAEFMSASTGTAITLMKSFLSTIKSRSRDIQNLLTRLQRAYVLMWENMLTEHALDYFYGNVSQDINILFNEPEHPDRAKLIKIFAFMLDKKSAYITEHSSELPQLTNGDFVTTSVDEKTAEVGKFFATLKEMNDIETDEDDFLNAFKEMEQSMGTFLANNDVDERFFGKNFMQVDVFMKELSYEQIDQQIAYDMTSLWSDIGGSIGLFIGASVITLFELFDVLIRNVYRFYCNCGQREKKQNRRQKVALNGLAEKSVML